MERKGRGNEHGQAETWEPSVADIIWGKVSKAIAEIDLSTLFIEDEKAKWFGHWSQMSKQDDETNRIETQYIVETSRLRDLMAQSLNFGPDSPSTQFPSIVSFVGASGAGKSLLGWVSHGTPTYRLRYLIHLGETDTTYENMQSPITGGSLCATTGEVNLYADPSTIGTSTPLFLADCEGMGGDVASVASSYQMKWHSLKGKSNQKAYYFGDQVDRKYVIKDTYPRLLYIFSDVICYVVGEKAWSKTITRLLNWSTTGAQHTINQAALPALILIINLSMEGKEEWVSEEGGDIFTRHVLEIMNVEAATNKKLKDMAQKYNISPDSSGSGGKGQNLLESLLLKSYSSVHAHFIPRVGLEKSWQSDAMLKQAIRLQQLIKLESGRVQEMRAKSLTKFNTYQLEAMTDYAFSHIVENPKIPLAVIELHIFHPGMKRLCKEAIHEFLESYMPCSYVNENADWKCVNTKNGHVKGHQSEFGDCFVNGEFEEAESSIEGSLMAAIETKIHGIVVKARDTAGSSPQKWYSFVSMNHKQCMEELRKLGVYSRRKNYRNILDRDRFLSLLFEGDSFINSQFCTLCLFGKSEYRLPCQHMICGTCLKENSASNRMQEPDAMAVLEKCVLCDDNGRSHGWPFTVQMLPVLTNPRILALDGAGVRGVTQLVLLERLEESIGLGLPIGYFFDLIVGSSMGGIIALGLGVQGLHVSECLRRFKAIGSKGFDNKLGTKTPGLKWISRRIRGSIYLQESYSRAVKEYFDNGKGNITFGLRNHCRVAVTTTVGGDARLIANYHAGDDEKYINSKMTISDAAQCSSMAPLYFEPMLVNGKEFWDGGLTANNPVQLALDESNLLWGTPRPDLVISIGTGHSSALQDEPVGLKNLDEKLKELMTPWLRTMNGQQDWKDFCSSKKNDPDTLARCHRLSVSSVFKHETAFDEADRVMIMEMTARTYDERLDLIHGEPFLYLLKFTNYFTINRLKVVDVDESIRRSQFFDMPIQFEHSYASGPIRIVVNFNEDTYSVAISGFPMDIQVLRDYCAENGIEEEELDVDLNFEDDNKEGEQLKFNNLHKLQQTIASEDSSSNGDPIERVMTPSTTANDFL
ncbi:hypothetical protein TWF102_004588 [Orbilia oligospora]|uniref:PNPLA domain-containing protein n=1 Tax=Orbilia oligospora TaxID=2813651 RepID=A0A7C8N9Z7_ORBOL|nr:hypothetical protein TWF102_004588 [Orbilia oligospora]